MVRKLILLRLPLITLLLFACLVAYSQHKHDKIFFENSIMDSHYYYSKAEYSSGCWIKNTQGKLPVSDRQFFTPGNSLELQYQSSVTGNWNATVLYPNIRGIDAFNDATHLSFWMDIVGSTEKESLPVVRLLLSEEQETEPTNLSGYLDSFKFDAWIQVRIPLAAFFKDGTRPAEEIMGVQFSKGAVSDAQGHLYIDQIELVPAVRAAVALTGAPQLLSAKGYERHIDLTWKKEANPAIEYVKVYRSTDGKNYQSAGIQSPQISGYTDFVGVHEGTIRYKLTYVDNAYRETEFSKSMSASTRSMSDDEFLDMIQESSFYTGWASQSAKAAKYRADWGQTTEGSTYTNGNTYYGIPLAVGVSNGGPLFFTHYSFLGLDPHRVTDKYTNYFENNKNIALINLRYCIENPENHRGYGDDFWGLTASDGPEHYSANEPNKKGDEGKMTPTGALASFPYTPEASMLALKNYYRNYGKYLYGYYGFRDAINLDKNWCSSIYMGLNQAPVVVMIENYRSKLLWDLFMSNPEVEKAREALGFK